MCAFQAFFSTILNVYFASSFGWFPLVTLLVVALSFIYITNALMRPVIPLAYAANKREGDLRFAHARIREFAESVVFYGGQDQECVNVDDRFSVLYSTLKAKLWAALPTYMFSTLYQQLIGVILFGILTIYFIYLDGFNASTVSSTLQTFMECAGYLGAVGTALASISTYVSQFSDVAGIVHRVAHVAETLRHVLSSYLYFENR